jgi:hypothetical protein
MLKVMCAMFGHDIKDKKCQKCGQKVGLPKIKVDQFPVPKKKDYI